MKRRWEEGTEARVTEEGSEKEEEEWNKRNSKRARMKEEGTKKERKREEGNKEEWEK